MVELYTTALPVDEMRLSKHRSFPVCVVTTTD